MAGPPDSTDPADSAIRQMISPLPSQVPSSNVTLLGKFVTITGLADCDISALWESLQMPANEALFYHFPWKIPRNLADFENTVTTLRKRGFVLFAIRANPSKLSTSQEHRQESAGEHRDILGMIAYLDIQPIHRTLEIGAVLYSPLLQRTTAATEAHYLILKNVLDGQEDSVAPPYRRVAWKCNKLNQASRRAAERLGFTYEGTFRNHLLSRGVSRDSDWLSIIVEEWSAIKLAMELWLDDSNFDGDGKQLCTLASIRSRIK